MELTPTMQRNVDIENALRAASLPVVGVSGPLERHAAVDAASFLAIGEDIHRIDWSAQTPPNGPQILAALKPLNLAGLALV